MKNRNALFGGLLFLVGLTILIPVLLVFVWAAASRWVWPGLIPEGVSLRGVTELFGSHSGAVRVLLSSIGLSLTAALAATIVGLMAARAFVCYQFRGRQLLSLAAMLPVIIPANVFALGIHVTFIRWGLSDSIPGILICHIIYCLPYSVSILTDITRSAGVAYEEQSLVLGAPPAKTFWHVTLPMILPGLFSAVAMSYIISFSQYFITVLIGGGRVKTYAMIMVPFISGGDRTITSAYVVLFLISSLCVFGLFEYVAKKWVAGMRA